VEAVINLQEHFGKIVGRRKYTVGDYDRLLANSTALMPRLPVPKGVFRFRSHEEADEWMNQHLMQAALKKARDRQAAAT
jgi:hypothetical protein